MREHVTVNLDERQRSDDSGLVFDVDDGMTKQSFSAECDINTIMARFERTGVLDHVAKYQGDYSDFSDATDYHDSLNAVLAADDMFMSLPAQVRLKFENDPARFLDFVNNPDNLSEMVDLGLAVAKETPSEGVVEPSDLGS